ncbi:30S ribosomal protein S4 [Candidatus Microgenomates bacterium]|nr:30S ribosomal protein S4 [Candidatus Microgenomates bacterium]
MRYTGPRNKVARREGMDLELKTPGSKAQASLLRKINVAPGAQQRTGRRRKKVSERSRQLREKQKLRFLFGISESQLKQYYTKAVRIKGNTGTILAEILERRLDNAVYRSGFAPTRAAARQLVNHRHITVNGKVLSIASHELSVGDVLTFANEKTTKIPYVEEILNNKSRIAPEWIQREANTTKIQAPTSDDIEKQVNMRSVIEYYSR